MNRRIVSLMLAMLAAGVSFAQEYKYRWGDTMLTLDRRGVVLGFSRADGAQGIVEGQDMPIDKMVQLAEPQLKANLKKWKTLYSDVPIHRKKSETGPFQINAPASFRSVTKDPSDRVTITEVRWVKPNQVEIHVSPPPGLFIRECSNCAPPCCVYCGIGCLGGAGRSPISPQPLPGPTMPQGTLASSRFDDVVSEGLLAVVDSNHLGPTPGT